MQTVTEWDGEKVTITGRKIFEEFCNVWQLAVRDDFGNVMRVSFECEDFNDAVENLLMCEMPG